MTARARVAMLVALLSACGGANGKAPASAADLRHDTAGAYEPLEPLLRARPDVAARVVDAANLRLQVLLTTPGEENGRPTLRRRGFRVDAEYFYPASAIKLCAAVAALEKIGDLRESYATPSLDATTPLRTYDAARAEWLPGAEPIASDVRKALAVSDNAAFGRLFDFVGHDEINERMARLGLSSARVRHRLVASDADPHDTPRMELVPRDAEPIAIPVRRGILKLTAPGPAPGILVGGAHIDATGSRLEEPMSFAAKNRISLRDLQDLLIMVMRPELMPGVNLRLGGAERALLMETLGLLPSESGLVPSDATLDAIHKPLHAAVTRALPGHRLRVFGKGGRAYGFVVDNSYVVDETTGRAFFLSVAMYVNADGIVNDDHYGYDDIALPLLQSIGELVLSGLSP